MEISILILIFFVIALMYSSAGFGGGSSYIAVLLLADLAVLDSRFIALVCNLIVVSSASYYFYKSGYLKIKKVIPLVTLSIPFAFIGGAIQPEANTYKMIAAVTLIIASTVMLLQQNKISTKSKSVSTPVLSSIGGGIGLMSGFIGIGGGIFLSPILHFIHWQSAKSISATACFFIFVNSIAGLVGQLTHTPVIDYKMCIFLGLAVFVGGRIGNRMNIHILSAEKIKFITAILIGLVGIRILITL